MGDLAGLLAGGGVAGTAVALVWIVMLYSRTERRDSDTTEDRLLARAEAAETARAAAEVARDAERTLRRQAEDHIDRLARQIRTLGGDPVP